MRPKAILAALVLAGFALPARAAELYGKPLRGLTPVAIADLRQKPAGHDGRTIQVRGKVAGGGAFTLTDGTASLRVSLRGSGAALPSDAGGASAVAEGVFRAAGPAGEPALEATGVELTR